MDKYITTSCLARETLDEYGVAIIPSVLDPEECEQMKNGMWNYLEEVTQDFKIPINHDDPKTYIQLYELYPKHSMLIQQWSIGHAQFIWDLRQNMKIVEVFSEIHNTAPEDLLVSFDGASFHMPHEITGRGYYRNHNWLHCDQSYTRNDFECVQGWVTAFDVDEGDASLIFYEGSHKYHADFAKEFSITEKKDWFKLEGYDQEQFYKDRCGDLVKITCPAGSLVLWDSRTIHSGQEPSRERAKPNFRCVAYMCYTPRELARPAALKKKQKAFNELRTTSHWPHKPTLFSKTPRTYGAELPNVRPIAPPVLDALGMQLAGF